MTHSVEAKLDDDPPRQGNRVGSRLAQLAAGLVLIALSLFISLYRSHGEWPGNYDGFDYLTAARGFVTHDFSYMLQGRPAYIFSLSLPCSLMDDPIAAGRFHTAFWTVCFVLSLFLLMRKECGDPAAFMVSLFVLANFFVVAYARQVMPQMQTLTMATVGMYFLLKSDLKKGGGWLLIFSGICFSLSFLTHPAFGFYLAVILVFLVPWMMLIPRDLPYRGRLREIFIFFIAMAIPVLFFEALTVFLVSTGKYKISIAHVYLQQFFAVYAPVLGSLVKSAAPAANLPAQLYRPDYSMMQLTGFIFQNAPLFWVLGGVGLICLLARIIRRKSLSAAFAATAIVSVIFFGIKNIEMRPRDIILAFPGAFLLIAVGLAAVQKTLLGSNRFHFLRISSLVLLYSLLLITFAGFLLSMPTLRGLTQQYQSSVAQQILRDGSTSVCVSGDWSAQSTEINLRLLLPPTTTVEMGTPGAKNTDHILLDLSGGSPEDIYRRIAQVFVTYPYHLEGLRIGSQTLALLKHNRLPWGMRQSKIVDWSQQKDNLIPDGGFERGIADWTSTGLDSVRSYWDTSCSVTGKGSLAIQFPKEFASNYYHLQTPVKVKPGKDYILDGYMLSDNSTRVVRHHEVWIMGRFGSLLTPPPPIHPIPEEYEEMDVWRKFEIRFQTPPGVENGALIIRRMLPDSPNPYPAFTVHFDNLRLRERRFDSLTWENVIACVKGWYHWRLWVTTQWYMALFLLGAFVLLLLLGNSRHAAKAAEPAGQEQEP